MRIAFLAGRSSIHTVRWVNAMAERGHEVHLITMHPYGDDLHPAAILHGLTFGPPHGYFLNVFACRRVLKRVKPDILNVHYASGYGTLGRLSGFHPLLLSVWGSDVYDFPYQSSLKKKLVVDNLLSADWVSSTGRVMAGQTMEICPGLPKLDVVGFGIETDKFIPVEGGEKQELITVGTVKKLDAIYGIDLLIRSVMEALAILREKSPELASKVRLMIVGDGEEWPGLEVLVEETGLGEITEFTGRIPHSEVPAMLNRLDVYLALSRYESFGVAILEASSCGLPVIVADVGGLPEVVEEGITGYIVERENYSAAAKVLAELIESSEKRKKMGKAGRRYVKKNYSWKDNVETMENLYRRVIAGSQ